MSLGSAAVLPCLASGFPVPEITWSKVRWRAEGWMWQGLWGLLVGADLPPLCHSWRGSCRQVPGCRGMC